MRARLTLKDQTLEELQIPTFVPTLNSAVMFVA